MSITQQQAIEALERVYYATNASFIDRNLVRQYIEQGAGAGAGADVVLREARETLLIAAANFGNLAPSARDRCIRSANALHEAYTPATAPLLTHKAEDAPTLLEAFKSGKAILIDWPMEPVTPQEALKLMGMMDAEHAKTMGKPAPDREMAVCMQRVQHMACDLWASQKEVIRSHFVELAVAHPLRAQRMRRAMQPVTCWPSVNGRSARKAGRLIMTTNTTATKWRTLLPATPTPS